MKNGGHDEALPTLAFARGSYNPINRGESSRRSRPNRKTLKILRGVLDRFNEREPVRPDRETSRAAVSLIALVAGRPFG